MSEAVFPEHVRFGDAPAPPEPHGPVEHALRAAVGWALRKPEIAAQPTAPPDHNTYTKLPLLIPGTLFRLNDRFHDRRFDDGSITIAGTDSAGDGGYDLFLTRHWSSGYQNVYVDWGEPPKNWETGYAHAAPDELITLLRDGDIMPVGGGADTARARAICEATAELPEIPLALTFQFNPATDAEHNVVTINEARVPYVSTGHIRSFGTRQRGIRLGERLEYAFGRLMGVVRENIEEPSGGQGFHERGGIVYRGVTRAIGRPHYHDVGLTPSRLVSVMHRVERRPDVADLYGFSPGARDWMRRYVLALHQA